MSTSIEPGPVSATPPPPSRRRRRWRLAAVAAVSVVLLLAGAVVRILWLGGAFRRIKPHFAGECRLIDGPVGAEDITINQRSGRAYISASDRRASAAGRPVPGAIWAYDLTDSDAPPVNLTPDAGIEFQPHGISLWLEPDGARDALHHRPPRARQRLAARTWWRSPTCAMGACSIAPRSPTRCLVMPNDLVAVGIDRFYLTNTHANRAGLLADARDLPAAARRHRARRTDREASASRSTAWSFPNGINVSPRRAHRVRRGDDLAAACWSTTATRATDALTARDEIPIASGGDNIEVDPDGNLWIGSHPKLLAVPNHAADPSVPAPAQVLRITAGGRTVGRGLPQRWPAVVRLQRRRALRQPPADRPDLRTRVSGLRDGRES